MHYTRDKKVTTLVPHVGSEFGSESGEVSVMYNRNPTVQRARVYIPKYDLEMDFMRKRRNVGGASFRYRLLGRGRCLYHSFRRMQQE